MLQRILMNLFALALVILLPACGFHPVYGGVSPDGTPVTDELSHVAIDPIPNQQGQMLRNYLIDRLNSRGRPSIIVYHLIVKVKISEEELGTLANGTTTLAAIHSSGDYTLTDANGKKLAGGSTSSVAQYDELANMYGTSAAHDSAIDRSMRELSEQLASRVSLYFSEQPEQPAP